MPLETRSSVIKRRLRGVRGADRIPRMRTRVQLDTMREVLDEHECNPGSATTEMGIDCITDTAALLVLVRAHDRVRIKCCRGFLG